MASEEPCPAGRGARLPALSSARRWKVRLAPLTEDLHRPRSCGRDWWVLATSREVGRGQVAAGEEPTQVRGTDDDIGTGKVHLPAAQCQLNRADGAALIHCRNVGGGP